jgi:rhodanese-related sulfurtransferase
VTNPQQFQEPFKRISVDEAKQLLDSGQATLIDVREQAEWDAGHIPGATLIPLNRILSNPGAHIKGDNIIFQCAVGARSAVAAEIAASLGISNLYNMEGGIDAWRKKGYPVDK